MQPYPQSKIRIILKYVLATAFVEAGLAELGVKRLYQSSIFLYIVNLVVLI